MYTSLGFDFLKEQECAPCAYDTLLNRCDCSQRDYMYKVPGSRGYQEVDLGPTGPSSRPGSSPTMAQAGMAGGSMLLLGAAVIAGAYYFGRNK